MTRSRLGRRSALFTLSALRRALPLALFLVVLSRWGGTVFAILASNRVSALALVPACGILIVMLLVIGHDAGHQSYTSSRLINHVIGRIAFLPALHSFSLWD